MLFQFIAQFTTSGLGFWGRVRKMDDASSLMGSVGGAYPWLADRGYGWHNGPSGWICMVRNGYGFGGRWTLANKFANGCLRMEDGGILGKWWIEFDSKWYTEVRLGAIRKHWLTFPYGTCPLNFDLLSFELISKKTSLIIQKTNIFS